MKKITHLVKPLLFLFILISSSIVVAQEQRTCGMVDYMEEQMQDPIFAREYKKNQLKFKAEFEKTLLNGDVLNRLGSDPIFIPVAVHFPGANESDRACLEALAQNQIDILNEDFTGTNADISQWPAASPNYPGVNTGIANIYFCIATMNHPAGTDADLVEGGPAVTIGYPFGDGDQDPNFSGYMNFVVRNIGGGILGYSPLGGSIAAGQSVVMNLGAFGSGPGCPASGIVPGAPYNLGRTVTHELGHFYNLNHTFADYTCSGDDGIADTPNIDDSSFGCPAAGSVDACVAGENALTMSYMDYVNDACMYMFSAGQTNVVDAYITAIQSQFKPDVLSCSVGPDFEIAADFDPVSVCAPSDGVFNLSFVTSGDYSDDTTFSAVGEPAGSTVTFSPTSMSADGDFTMTIGNLAGVIGDYTITITAAGSITKDLDVTLSVQAGAPGVPSLTSPADGATGTTTTLNLIWDDASNASTYTVQTATDAGFTADLTTDSVSGTSLNLSGLNPMTQYYWRVKSENGCGESAYSAVYDFTTAGESCATYDSTENIIFIPSNGDDPHVVTSTLNISDEISITDVNISINVSHTWAGDVDIKLTSPNGTEVQLLENSACDDGTNDIIVTYDDEAAGPVVCSTTAPAVGGDIQPSQALSAFDGEASNGDWILTVTDSFPGEDGGVFQDFALEICGTPLLSVEENDALDAFNIYPNPSNGTFNVSFNNPTSDNVNMTLYDLRGRRINSQTFENQSGAFNQTLRFDQLESAVYILVVETGNTKVNKRIVIKQY